MSYSCAVSGATILEPGTAVQFMGIHENGKKDHDVNSIFFQSSHVKFLPREIGLVFFNMRFLKVSGCGLKQITRRDLNGLEKLEHLNLSNNKLTFLPKDLFEGMNSLTQLNFYGNKITSLNSKILEPLNKENLYLVDFLKNGILDCCYRKRDPHSTMERLIKTIDDLCTPPKEREIEAAFLKKITEHLTPEMIMICKTELLQMAAKYRVQELKLKCEETLAGQIHDGNALDIFTLGTQHSSYKLKRAALTEIEKMFPDQQLDEKLMDDPQSLKELVAIKRRSNDILERYGKRPRTSTDESGGKSPLKTEKQA